MDESDDHDPIALAAAAEENIRVVVKVADDVCSSALTVFSRRRRRIALVEALEASDANSSDVL